MRLSSCYSSHSRKMISTPEGHGLQFSSQHPSRELVVHPQTCLSPRVAFFLRTLEVSVRAHFSPACRTRLTIGSDTSCILAWLIEEGYEVYAFMADVGQEEVSSPPLLEFRFDRADHP